MQLIHTWTYFSAENKILGLVKRFEEIGEDGKKKKNVIPYFKNDNGEWKPGGAPKPRPLYNLPGIKNSNSIIIVEGEKCAEALVQLGLPATTSCGGASGTKDADWSPCINAKKIYLVPDADLPGEMYMEQAAAQIATLSSEPKFFILRLPNLSPKGDIVDWLIRQVPAWDEYSPIDEEDAQRIKPLLKTLFLSAVSFYPNLQTEEPSVPKKQTDSDDHVNRLREVLTFSSILAHYGLSAVGQNKGNGCTVISSPFSSDSNPSFNFNETGKWFHCFSSGEKGDVFNLIAKLENCNTNKRDWPKVLAVAEKITGIVRPKQEKKSNVTSILSKLPLNLNSVATELCSIPNEEMSAVEIFNSCEPVLRRVAESDGVADEIVLDEIRIHFKLKATALKPFRKAIAAYRKELKEKGQIDNPKNEFSGEKPMEAPRGLYLELFPKFLGTIKRDIFSGDALFWDAQEGIYSPVLNQMKLLKSRFLQYGEQNNIRFFMNAVDYHFEEYAANLKPELVIEVPAWDGIDYLKQLANRVVLADVEIDGVGKIDNTVLEEFIKEWHAKMWQKLNNPQLQNRILVLKGDQGIGKDFWQLEQLGGLGQFVVPMTVEDSNKDTKAQLHQGLAITISEFDRTVKQHTSTIKELLTAATTMIRLPYDARARPRYVRCSFMASCNVDEVLRDYTGNRRYVLFSLLDIDRSQQFTDAQKLQVLAQGQALALQNYRVSPQSEKLMAGYIKQETPTSPLDNLIEDWNEMAHNHYLTKLTEEQRNEAVRIAKRPDAPKDSFGFMANKWMLEEKLLEKISRKFGWNEKYVANLLNKAKKKGLVRSFGITERGFYWQNPNIQLGVTENASIVADCSSSPISESDDLELNFL